MPDGGDLAGAMAPYFELFAAGLQDCEARWIKYTDVLTGTDLLAACLPIFQLSNGQSTCDGGGSDGWSKLLGVSCIDMNMMADLPTLEAHPQYPQFRAAYEEKAKKCPNIVVSDTQREDMQATVGQAGARCRNGRPGGDKCPNGATCSSVTWKTSGVASGSPAVGGLVALLAMPMLMPMALQGLAMFGA